MAIALLKIFSFRIFEAQKRMENVNALPYPKTHLW